MKGGGEGGQPGLLVGEESLGHVAVHEPLEMLQVRGCLGGDAGACRLCTYRRPPGEVVDGGSVAGLSLGGEGVALGEGEAVEKGGGEDGKLGLLVSEEGLGHVAVHKPLDMLQVPGCLGGDAGAGRPCTSRRPPGEVDDGGSVAGLSVGGEGVALGEGEAEVLCRGPQARLAD